MRGLISFSLYGSSPKYVLGMYENVELARTVYPGWDVVVYLEAGHWAADRLQSLGATVIQKPPMPASGGMFWRLEAVNLPGYTHCIVRDADSRLNLREKACVDEWIASGKDLHVIRDHPAHNNIPVLGGAHGYRCAGWKSLPRMLSAWDRKYHYGDDELFLKSVWSACTSTMAHSSQGRVYGDEVPIPDVDGGCFVCEPMVPDWRKHLTKLHVLNPDHYKQRFDRFCKAIESSEILRELEVVRVRGSTVKDKAIPYWWKHDRPWWWLATQDHIDQLERSYCANDDLLLMFEDDGLPNEHFDKYFTRAWNALPPCWHALMLGGQTDREREYVGEGLDDHLARAVGVRGQHSVLWNRRGMHGFYSHAKYWGMQTIDEAFEGYQKEFKTVYAPARWITDIVGVQFGQDR